MFPADKLGHQNNTAWWHTNSDIFFKKESDESVLTPAWIISGSGKGW